MSENSHIPFTFNAIEDEDDEEQEKPAEIGNENETPEIKQTEANVNDDEPMPEIKNEENMNNGSPNDDETASQKGNTDADDAKELADGEIADLSGDESKATDAPETIDLGKFSHMNSISNCYFIKINKFYFKFSP